MLLELLDCIWITISCNGEELTQQSQVNTVAVNFYASVNKIGNMKQMIPLYNKLFNAILLTSKKIT